MSPNDKDQKIFRSLQDVERTYMPKSAQEASARKKQGSSLQGTGLVMQLLDSIKKELGSTGIKR